MYWAGLSQPGDGQGRGKNRERLHSLLCMKDGSKFVLYSADARSSFNLDDQDKPREYAGEKVTIVGTYDGQSKTIQITSIIAAP